MAAKKKRYRRKIVPSKRRRREVMDEEMVKAGATVPGQPAPAPGELPPRLSRVPRRSASPCKGPKMQSPM